jgi:hypothetical protein
LNGDKQLACHLQSLSERLRQTLECDSDSKLVVGNFKRISNLFEKY